MSGFVGDLSSSQEKALEELKKRVDEFVKEKIEKDSWVLSDEQKELLSKDDMYLRFLRARKWDLNAAYDMYIATSIWRRSFQDKGVENITEEDVENELKTGKCFFYGYDKKKRVIIYIKPRLHIPSECNVEEMERFVVFITETGRRLAQPGIETGLVIYDMNGFGLGNMDYSQVKRQIHILESYYPESMGTTLIVNSPWLFSACWKLIKGWIDPVAAAKIKFVGMNELPQYVDEDILLKEYGGKNPYEYSYIPVKERDENFIPTWKLPWTTAWKEEKNE